jgi:hypothetical protein
LKENTVKKFTIRFFAGPLALLALATMFISPAFAEENHGQKASQVTVHLWDYCDPDTFNAALGSGTCNRDTATGAITVTGFLQKSRPTNQPVRGASLRRRSSRNMRKSL